MFEHGPYGCLDVRCGSWVAEPCLCSTMGPMVALTLDVEASSTGRDVEQAMPTVNKRKTIEILVNNRIDIFLRF